MAIERVQAQISDVVSSFNPTSSGPKIQDKELFRKSVKVVDLLQHSAELGNTDALYTLAQISLVCPSCIVH